jgi:hypothetical protein
MVSEYISGANEMHPASEFNNLITSVGIFLY